MHYLFMLNHLPPVEHVLSVPLNTYRDAIHFYPHEDLDVIQPGEFEAQEALWLVWSCGCAKKDHPYSKVTIDILKAISPENKAVIIYDEKLDLEEIQKKIRAEIGPLENIAFYPISNETIWLRDTGPTFVKTKNGSKRLVQFQFNEWGYSDPEQATTRPDYDIPFKIAQTLNLPLNCVNYISEGGNRETNGKGVLLAVSEVEARRNPEATLKQLEFAYQYTLGIKKTIWLPSGLSEDAMATQKVFIDQISGRILFTPFTPGGHIDEFCRFADEHTILLAEVIKTPRPLHSLEIENEKVLERCYQILLHSTDCDGNPFKIVRIPTPMILIDEFTKGDHFYDFFTFYSFEPNSVFKEGRFPHLKTYPIAISASYLNFVKINNVVLIPFYWKEGLPEELKETDLRAYEMFKKVFPSHRIVQIDTYNVNLAGGGIHCMTLNEPR